MLEILLVFIMDNNSPAVSDRIFTSYEECADFVNGLVGEVVQEDYTFDFLSSDGQKFTGVCVDKRDYQ